MFEDANKTASSLWYNVQVNMKRGYEMVDKNITFPKRSGNWEIIEELGSGSFGTVYKVRSMDDGAVCAVKILSIPEDDRDVDRLMNEYRNENSVRDYYLNMVSSVEHEINNLEILKGNDNIVQIKGAYIKEKRESIGWNIFIFMECLNDFAGSDEMRNSSEENVISLGLEMCNALEACEKNNILHRDIKPENILVDDDGVHKLCDFGVAKEMEKTLKTNSVKGTFAYMAPEVYLGKKSGKQSDIYSLGLILYNMMNKGRGPFINLEKHLVYSKDITQALNRRVSGEALPKPALASDGLASIILKACAFSLDDRYESAEELRRDLQLLQEGKYKTGKKNRKYGKKDIELRGSTVRRILTCGVAVVILAIAVIGGVHIYKDHSYYDKCSDILLSSNGNVSAALNRNGVLTISGEGSPDVTLSSTALISYMSDIKEIRIEEGITGTGASTMQKCTELTSVSLPDSLTDIGNSSFVNCSKLESVSLGDNVERIGVNAFGDCISLRDIEFGDKLECIDDNAFSGCRSLNNVKLPKSLKSIGAYAFCGCSSLSSISGVNNVKSVGANAFEGSGIK